MVQTIESFVTKLQQEAVEVAQQRSGQIIDEAQRQADKIIEQAKKQAGQIADQARRQAQANLDRAQTEMQLAGRDASLKLRESLNLSLRALLKLHVENQLQDARFLHQLLHELIMLYAEQDSRGHVSVEIRVSEQMRSKLVQWALAELGREIADSSRDTIDIKGTLAQAGFEYRTNGATIEVTTESVVGTLFEMVSPALRTVLKDASEKSADNR